MRELKQPTKELIEAALSEHQHILTYASGRTDQAMERVRIFREVWKASRELQIEVKGIAEKFDSMELENWMAEFGPLPPLPADFPTPNEIRVVTTAAEFFFIGWHARGASDEAEELNRLNTQ